MKASRVVKCHSVIQMGLDIILYHASTTAFTRQVCKELYSVFVEEMTDYQIINCVLLIERFTASRVNDLPTSHDNGSIVYKLIKKSRLLTNH